MRATLLCAGIGTRFRPISYTTPKPLVPINGLPLIEHMLRLLKKNDIAEIMLITGYRADQFEYLTTKYGVTTRHNPQYETLNNSSSLRLAADWLDDTLIIDADLVFLNNFIPLVQAGRSQFIVQKTTHGLEWEVHIAPDGRITGVQKNSPTGYGMVGVSYWCGEGGKALAKELETSADDDFWEDAACRIVPGGLVYATCTQEPFVQEIDSVKDALDFHLLTHEEIANLSNTSPVPPVKLKGLTNNTWKITDHAGVTRCLRVPGSGTDAFIKREEEPLVVEAVKSLGITPETIFHPGGIKLSRFLDKHRIVTNEDMNEGFFKTLNTALEKLHSIEYTPHCGLAPMLIRDQIALYEKQSGRRAPQELRAWLLEKAAYYDKGPQTLCHRDLLLENILVSGPHGEGLQLIDFEYAGFTHPYWDTASLILESGITGTTHEAFVKASGVRSAQEAKELFEMEILVDYVWGMWGEVNNYLDYAENRIKRSLVRLQAMLDEG